MSDPWPALGPGEYWVDDPQELWLRQVKPVELNDVGDVGRAAFSLNDVERASNRSSGALGALQCARGAYEEAVQAQVATVGTWGVSVEEIHGAGFKCIDDHETVTEPPKGHASLAHHAVTLLSRRERRERRDELANAANARGCLHAP